MSIKYWTEDEIRNPNISGPIGDPTCKVCKKCRCYKVCFSGMKGFPKTSSNFGKAQADCATHKDKCGIKHYPQQTTLTEI